MQPLSVTLGDRSYPIHIGTGLLDDAKLYAPHVASKTVAVITNSVVAPLYLERIQRAIEKAGGSLLSNVS